MIESERLILRPFEVRDRAPFRAQCDDPQVMRYLMPIPDEAAMDAMVERLDGFLRDHGHTFWAIERKSDGAMLGLCGLKPGPEGTPLENMVEIGWRLGSDYFGQGYAHEAAQATLGWAWANLDVAEIGCMTVPANTASWGLMERLGMTRVADGDFDHPALAEDSPLKRHIQYRIARPLSA